MHHGLIKGFQHGLEAAIEEPVKPCKSAAFAPEDEVGVVKGVAVDEEVGLGLGGDAFEPFALGAGEGVRGQGLLEGMVHPLAVGDELVAGSGLADVADDAGGNVLIGGFAPGGMEIGFGEAGLVELVEQFAELFAGKFARAGEDGVQGWDTVALVADEGGELAQVVLWLLGTAVAAFDAAEFVGVFGDVEGREGPFGVAIENAGEGAILGEELGALRQAAESERVR